jgi:hypothetical protein
MISVFRGFDVDAPRTRPAWILCGSVECATRFDGGEIMLKAGDKAPEFEVLDQESRKVSSKDLKGKRYVLWFYPKADTPG